MPRKATKKLKQTTIRLDAAAQDAESALTELLGSPNTNYTIRFALVELERLARLIRQGATLFVRLPNDEGVIALSLNQIKQATDNKRSSKDAD